MSNKLNFNISNSLISKFNEYLAGHYCGKRFEAVLINKTHQEDYGDSANAGQWFEYKATGQRLRDGAIPLPTLTKKGELTAKYKYLEAQLVNFSMLYKSINIIEAGKTLNIPLNGFNIKMIFDVWAEFEGKNVVRDIKTTGHLNNKWDSYGWAGDLTFKKHISQAKMYIWGVWKTEGVITDFYFDVFSSVNSTDFKIFKVTMTEEKLKEFEKDLIDISEQLQLESAIGFKTIPTKENCKGCPLAGECKEKTLMPEVIEVNIS